MAARRGLVRTAPTLLLVAGLLFGAWVESVAFAAHQVEAWLPDLIVGWTFLVTGWIADYRRSHSTGVLLGAVGLAWFAGTLAPELVFLHRGPLVHLLITYPVARPARSISAVAVALGYLASLWPVLWTDASVTLVGAGALVGLLGIKAHRATGRQRRYRRVALAASLPATAVIAVGAIVRMFDGTPGSFGLAAYQAALCALAVILVASLAGPSPQTVTDLVVELGETRSGTARDQLARALGDPTLRLGFWSRDLSAYVDEHGTLAAPSASDPDRSATKVDRGGHPFALLVHDSALQDDPALTAAVTAAGRLATSNAALQAEVVDQVVALNESRRALLIAADEERRRLEARLRSSTEQHLRALSAALPPTDPKAQPGSHAGKARDQLELTLSDLDDLAQGLYPRALRELGLAGALKSLDTGALPFSLSVDVPNLALPDEVVLSVWFVCVEALANAAKHAHARRVAIAGDLTEQRILRISISDDGVGGAQETGAGLRGLADRMGALGGELRVINTPGAGPCWLSTSRSIASTVRPHRLVQVFDEHPRIGHDGTCEVVEGLDDFERQVAGPVA